MCGLQEGGCVRCARRGEWCPVAGSFEQPFAAPATVRFAPRPPWGTAPQLRRYAPRPPGRNGTLIQCHRVSLCGHRCSPPPPYTNSMGCCCLSHVGREERGSNAYGRRRRQLGRLSKRSSGGCSTCRQSSGALTTDGFHHFPMNPSSARTEAESQTETPPVA